MRERFFKYFLTTVAIVTAILLYSNCIINEVICDMNVSSWSEEISESDTLWQNQNCIDWSSYGIKTCIETDKENYFIGDTVLIRYSIINIDIDTLHWAMGGWPAIKFMIDKVGWSFPIYFATLLWDLVLESGESYSESTCWDMKDSTGTMVEAGQYKLSGYFVGLGSPDPFLISIYFNVLGDDASSDGDINVLDVIEYGLYQNYPNPFNRETKIEFGLPINTKSTIVVYNILGQVIEVLVDTELNAGYHNIQWNAKNVASGVYFYRITAGEYIETKRMLLLR